MVTDWLFNKSNFKKNGKKNKWNIKIFYLILEQKSYYYTV